MFAPKDSDSFKKRLARWLTPKCGNDHNNKTIARKDFPADFRFGCATSALQTEGSGTEGGRGPATWDSYIQDDTTPGTDIAVDSYHRYKEDAQLLKAVGVDTYRFSMSWSRILPEGTIDGGINREGINFYNNLVDELIAVGIWLVFISAT